MKLSLRSEYALLSLVHLARIHATSSLAEIAEAQQIPVEALDEVLLVLMRSGYATRSNVGGRFGLAKCADKISVAEVIRLFDGALALLEPVSTRGYTLAPLDREEKLAGLFEQIQGQISARLEVATIAEME
jgi:Rrf2 family protein